MKKRIPTLLLIFVLLCAGTTARADTARAQAAADHLYQLGLFQGTSISADGRPVYELDRAPTRYEAVAMLVRLLGKEGEAQSGNWDIPFTDVAGWARPYVGYAYAHGLTNGTDMSHYSGQDFATDAQYLTFVLRALGYQSGSDFQWNRSWELADRIGLTDGSYGSGGAFTRGDVAVISDAALSAVYKGSNETLLERLAAESAVDASYVSGVGALTASATLDVYSVSDERYLRSLPGVSGSLADLGGDEYLSFSAVVKNNGRDLDCASLYATIDGGEELHWSAGTFPADSTWRLHIYYSNMGAVLPGLHTVCFYVNDTPILTQKFTLHRDWSKLMNLPSRAEISAFAPSGRAPYIGVYQTSTIPGGYTEYSVDFCADMLPKGTYLSTGQWDMDLGSLSGRYANVYRDYPNCAAYAGFQSTHDGSRVAIMSFWDIYCQDGDGTVQTIRPKAIYTAPGARGDGFEGEGTGAQRLIPYAWEEGRWYRLLLQCSTAADTGNTLVSMWACDLETEQWTQLCEYDTCLKDSYFTGSMTPFLENYLVGEAGEMRTMELCNMRAKSRMTGEWVELEQLCFYQNFDYAGSYNYGSDGHSFWVITTGLPGRCPVPQAGAVFSVTNDRGASY